MTESENTTVVGGKGVAFNQSVMNCKSIIPFDSIKTNDHYLLRYVTASTVCSPSIKNRSNRISEPVKPDIRLRRRPLHVC